MKAILTNEEEVSLVEAIREQEARTSAEIRICVTYKFILRPERYAWRIFNGIGMRDTRQRNGALIVMMPRMKTVVIIGDSGFDAVVPPNYWPDAVASMVRRMHDSGPLDALLGGLRLLGDTLSTHWPRGADDVNELSDDLVK